VQQLQRSKHVFRIQPRINATNQTGVQRSDMAAATTPGEGAGAGIYFDPNDTSGPRDSSGSTTRPAFVGLGHELGHAKLADEGRYNADYGSAEEDTTPPAETDVLPIENSIRSEHNLPPRDSYYDYED